MTISAFCGTAAFVGGFIDAVAGGGGLLTLPALLMAGIPPHLALGTNKISSTLGTSVALGAFALSGLILWRLALCGTVFSLAGSWLGSSLAMAVNPALLGKILVILLPFGMIAVIVPKRNSLASTPEMAGARFWITMSVSCLLIGMYDGFFGPATGSFLILAFHWLLNVDLLRASATAKVLNLASNISAAIAFTVSGHVCWGLALVMGLCSITGNWFGSRIAIRIGQKAVRTFLFLSLSFLLATLVWRFFISPAGI